MRLTSVVTLSAALLLSSTAMAQDKKLAVNEQAAPSYQASSESSNVGQSASEGGKRICKRLATSGTRMAKRTCLTKQEWDKVEDEVK